MDTLEQLVECVEDDRVGDLRNLLEAGAWATPLVVRSVAQAVLQHKNDPWYGLLLISAFTHLRDMGKAIQVANLSYKQYPTPPQKKVKDDTQEEMVTYDRGQRVKFGGQAGTVMGSSFLGHKVHVHLDTGHKVEVPIAHVKPLETSSEREPVNQIRKTGEDIIPGGMGDDKALDSFDAEQLSKGTQVEMEHTDDPNVASEIARDHLTEDPDYYKKLEKVEETGEEEYGEEDTEEDARVTELRQLLEPYMVEDGQEPTWGEIGSAVKKKVGDATHYIPHIAAGGLLAAGLGHLASGGSTLGSALPPAAFSILPYSGTFESIDLEDPRVKGLSELVETILPEAKAEGERFQGASGRWFVMKGGRPVPAAAPGGSSGGGVEQAAQQQQWNERQQQPQMARQFVAMLNTAIRRGNVESDGRIYLNGRIVDATPENVEQAVHDSRYPERRLELERIESEARKNPNATVYEIRSVLPSDSDVLSWKDAIKRARDNLLDSEGYVKDIQLAGQVYLSRNSI